MKIITWIKLLLVVLLPAQLVALPPVSNTLNITGTTVGAPKALFPLLGSTPGSCSLNGTAEPYSLYSVSTDANTTVTINITNVIDGGGTDDTGIFVYSGTFDPMSGCTNFIKILNDPVGSNLTFAATANTVYTIAVVGLFGTEDDFGTTLTATTGNISLGGAPATPSSISGVTTQCPNITMQTYSVVQDLSVETYNWTVPTGWIITGGDETHSITVTTGTAGQNGNITVSATNDLGTSGESTLAVTVNPLPRLQASINGVTVTSNNDGITDMGTVNLCGNGAMNNLYVSSDWVELNAAPTNNLKVFQKVVSSTNTTVPICNNCVVALTAYNTSLAVTLNLSDPNMPGTLVASYQIWNDVNNNDLIDMTECSGDIIQFTFNQPSVVAFGTPSVAHVTCFGGNNGSIVVSATGGTGTKTYTISPNIGTQSPSGTFSSLTAQTYTFTATDASGCTKTTTATVTQPTAVTFGTPTVTNVTCNGGNNGSVVVSATGGTGAITYSISPIIGTQSPNGTFSGLTAQTYIFTATDANGCTKTTTAEVTQPTAVTFGTPIVKNLTCLGGNDGIVVVSATGGTGAISYAILPNTGVQNLSGTFSGLKAQTYTFTATDANGCQATTTAIIAGGLPAIICPPSININPNQLNSSGIPLTSVTGELSFAQFCFSANQVVFTDRIYDVHCDMVTPLDGSPANIIYNPNERGDVVRIFLRLFNATNVGSSISYSCTQWIYVNSFKLIDVSFPSDQTLLCANSPIEPNDAMIGGVLVAGKGKPTIQGKPLRLELTNNLSASYTDVRITNTNGFTIKRTWVVKNDCTGETRSIIQNLTFRNDAGTCPSMTSFISGNIQREDLMAVPAQIMVQNADNESLNSTTSTQYSFNNLLMNNRYRITPERPNTDWNIGVTTFDIALISRHVLGVSTFSFKPVQI